MAEMDRFLRQKVSGTIYHWTPTLAKRLDMVPFDPETALTRIEALKLRLKDLNTALTPQEEAARTAMFAGAVKSAEELSGLEAKIESAENALAGEAPVDDTIAPVDRIENTEVRLADQKNEVLSNDSHLKRISKMTKKAEVRGYILEEFGEDVDSDSSMNLTPLKELAAEKRKERLFESSE